MAPCMILRAPAPPFAASLTALAAALFCGAALPEPALGSSAGFLGRAPSDAPTAVPADILQVLERALGGGELYKVAEDRLSELEDSMRPIFKSLPKTPEGLLPASGVRYLLHRVFVARHTWFVRGVENTGEGWHGASPSEMFAEAPGAEDADDLFASLLRRRGGLGLREAAGLAAALESLVHAEFLDRLSVAHRMTRPRVAEGDVPSEEDGEPQVETTLDAFMLMYVMAVDHAKVSAPVMEQLWKRSSKYPHWNATKAWVREVREEVLSAIPDDRTSYSSTVQVVREMMDRYGRWQNHECSSMKEDLMAIEWNGTGRVRLQDFYHAALGGKWLFSERREYLRESGCLDESNPSQPAVLIANYVNAPSNCLADSKYYSVCCVNECEALLGPIELSIAAPEALPIDIVEVVEQLPSPTVEAPRRLPTSLLRRLEEIAAHHGGRVPLHGRLFAQWMHHAYPRECPYPHVAGSTTPLRGKDWERRTGQRAVLGKTGLREQLAELEAMTIDESEEEFASDGGAEPQQPQQCAELPWSAEEELLVVAQPSESPSLSSSARGEFGSADRTTLLALGIGDSGSAVALLRDGMKVLAALSMCAVVLNMARSPLRAVVPGVDKDKMLV